MSPSTHQSGAGEGSLSWVEKIALRMDEQTAVACIRGIESEDRARRVLGLVNEHGVSDARKDVVVGRVTELAD